MNTNKSDYKFLFVIYTCYKNLNKSVEILKLVNSNINKLCKGVLIYGNPNLDTEYVVEDDNNIIILKVEDDYDNLNKKTIKMIKTLNKLYPNIEGLFKCDDDVIINFDNINNLIEQLNINSKDYFGKININVHEFESKWHIGKVSNQLLNIPIKVPICKYCSGPLYYLGKKSLNILDSVELIDNFYEDVMIGYNLELNGIKAENICLITDKISELKSKSYHNNSHQEMSIDYKKIIQTL